MSKQNKTLKIFADDFFTKHRIHAVNNDSKVLEDLKEKVLSAHLSYISGKQNMKQNKSPNLIFAFAGGLFAMFAIVAIAYFIIFPSVDRQPKTLGGEVSYTEGQVEYKAEGSGWLDAEVGTQLKQTDMVRVLGDGRAIIALDDGSAIRLDNDSEISLKSLTPENIEIENTKGKIYARIYKSERNFSVQVDDATFLSMGTSYKTFNLDNAKGVKVYHSAVKVKQGEKEEIVKQGEQFFILNQSDSSIENKVTQFSTESILNDDFVIWNKEEDKKDDVFKNELGILEEIEKQATIEPEPTFTPIPEPEEQIPTQKPEPTATKKTQPTSTPKQQASLSLSGKVSDSGITFNWSTSGIDVSKGFKIVKSTDTKTPVYPGNEYAYLSDGNQRSYTWSIKDGKTYHFRICQYLGGSCGVYSNTVTLTAPVKAEQPKPTEPSGNDVSSISLYSNGGTSFGWNVNGTSSQGFKLVYSKNSNPTYPCREGDYYAFYSSADTRTGSISAKDGSGTYYVKVCEYLSGKCGVYSNQVSVEL